MIDLFDDTRHPVPGLDGVHVRAAPADAALLTLMATGDDALRHRLVELCVVDAAGNRLIPDGQAERLPMATFIRLLNAAMEHNPFGDGGIEAAEGN